MSIEANDCVAISSTQWDTDTGYVLWQASDPDVILFSPEAARLAVDSQTGRPALTCIIRRRQVGSNYEIVGGTLTFTIDTGITLKTAELNALADLWRDVIRADTTGKPKPSKPEFRALNTRHAKASVFFDEGAGKWVGGVNDLDIGTPGGRSTFVLTLTAAGAQEWKKAAESKVPTVSGGVRVLAEYARMEPQCGAHIKIDGKLMFDNLSAELDQTIDGVYYSGSHQISVAWSRLRHQGAVTIDWHGGSAPTAANVAIDTLISTFVTQALKMLFDTIFVPIQDPVLGKPGTEHGIFGGINWALLWKHREEAVDLTCDINFSTFTWLTFDMDAQLSQIAPSELSKYVSEIDEEIEVVYTYAVHPCVELNRAVVNWMPTHGAGVPQSRELGAVGQSAAFTINTADPATASCTYDIQSDYNDAHWPISSYGGKQQGAGITGLVIKPSADIGRHQFYLVQEGNFLSVEELNSLSLNLSATVSGPHLEFPFTEGGPITRKTVTALSYPMDHDRGQPGREPTTVVVSVSGEVDGHVRFTPETSLSPTEFDVYVVVATDGIHLRTASHPNAISQLTGMTRAGIELASHSLTAHGQTEVWVREKLGNSSAAVQVIHGYRSRSGMASEA